VKTKRVNSFEIQCTTEEKPIKVRTTE